MCPEEKDSIKIIEYEPRYAEATVRMWRASKEKALGQQEVHSFEDHVFFLNHILNKENKIYIAVEAATDRVVGVAAFNEHEISQLYIDTDYQRQGLGERFVRMAKAGSRGRLRLYTFEVNHQARRFYEKHGFRITGWGHENEENLPDIKYEWAAGDGARDEKGTERDI